MQLRFVSDRATRASGPERTGSSFVSFWFGLVWFGLVVVLMSMVTMVRQTSGRGMNECLNERTKNEQTQGVEKNRAHFCLLRVVYLARLFGVVLAEPPAVERRALCRVRGDPSSSEEDREVELLRAHEARDPTSRHQQ